MEWYQVLTIIVATFGMFLWSRKETKDEIKEMREDMKKFRELWATETKDFHARLCVIEKEKK